MNDEGHRIFITFIDGVPQTEIPEGYYPVGDPIDINTVVNAFIPTIEGISQVLQGFLIQQLLER